MQTHNVDAEYVNISADGISLTERGWEQVKSDNKDAKIDDTTTTDIDIPELEGLDLTEEEKEELRERQYEIARKQLAAKEEEIESQMVGEGRFNELKERIDDLERELQQLKRQQRQADRDLEPKRLDDLEQQIKSLSYAVYYQGDPPDLDTAKRRAREEENIYARLHGVEKRLQTLENQDLPQRIENLEERQQTIYYAIQDETDSLTPRLKGVLRQSKL